MHVLLSNDDGINAEGIRALAQAFIHKGWQVTIAAPDGQRSAAGHAITVFEPISVRETKWPGAKAYAIGGTPADCVRVALHNLAQKVDIVVSGINDGYNLGSDVIYSGTAAAAREAVLSDIPAIAVSTAPGMHEGIVLAAKIAQEAARKLLAHPLRSGSMLNINVPGGAVVEGFRQVPLGKVTYADAYDFAGTDAQGNPCYRLCGSMKHEPCGAAFTDVQCVQKNMVAFTAIGLLAETEEDLQVFLQD